MELVEVEVKAKTVEEATSLAIAELGLESAEQAEITVVQEAKGGFMGLGSQPAVIIARAKPAQPKRRRRRRRKGNGNRKESGSTEKSSDDRPKRKSGGGGKSSKGGRNVKKDRDRDNGGGQAAGTAPSPPKPADTKPDRAPDIDEQGQVAVEFLEGLLAAFGLEGEVSYRIDDDILLVDMSGDQTEALIGPRGVILSSVLELTRTVVQRKTFGSPRMRLDIAGYSERRRAALKIYTNKLAAKLVAEGGEVMLEPMNPADRKVVHDAVAEIDGVRSFSEGEDPNRSVVLAADAPPAAEVVEEDVAADEAIEEDEAVEEDVETEEAIDDIIDDDDEDED
jgi:spoIIIJ-associated protein